MAIKVSGTTVINDSRALQNIASLDATTTSTINAVVGSSDLVAATGGTITTDGDFKVHKFTSDGTFTITAAGGSCSVLIVSGGGRGGRGATSGRSGGGGGAGGAAEFSFQTFSTGAYTVVVGAGSPVTGDETGSQLIRGNPSGILGPDFYQTGMVGGGNYGVQGTSGTANTGGGGGGGGGYGFGGAGGSGIVILRYKFQ